MKAAFLTEPGRFDVSEIRNPEIAHDTDVLLKVDAVGICGSDLHYFRSSRIGDQVVKHPFIIGHECVCTVLDTGPAVTSVRAGGRVVVDPAVSCGKCDQCRNGRPNTCRHLRFLGCPGQLPGCLAEILCMPEACCYPIPDRMSAEEAVMIEPLSIALQAWDFVQSVHARKIGILGSGAIGLSVLLTAGSLGATQIFATDKVPARLEMAKTMGAGWIANPDETDAVDAAPFEADAVFECCGQQDAFLQGVRLLKPGGHFVMVGIPEEDDISVPIHEMRRKEIHLHNVRRQNSKMKEAVELALKERPQLGRMVTHRYGLHGVQQAFEKTSVYADGVVKAIVAP